MPDLDLLAEIEDNPERERITAALAELDTLLADHPRRHCTQIRPCTQARPCEARQALTRIRTTLTEGDHHDR